MQKAFSVAHAPWRTGAMLTGALGHFWKAPSVIYRGHPFGRLFLVTRDIPGEHFLWEPAWRLPWRLPWRLG